MGFGRETGPNRRQQQEVDLEKLLEGMAPVLQNVRKGMGGASFPGLLVPVLGVLLVIWLASGFYIVGPDERGVVRRFGAYTGMTEPGPRWHIPFPVEQVDKVNVTQVRRMELGFRSGRAGIIRETEESLMITGDENIVDVQMIIQYRVTEPDKFLFRVWDPEGPPDQRTLRDAAEAALRLVVGQRGIDDVLTVEKAAVQEDTKTFLQELLTLYQTGIRIDQVQLQDVQPPEQVQAAFKDVVSAKEDKEQMVNRAKGYEQDIIPKARGEAERILREAEAYREQRIRQAEGDAARFREVLAAYAASKDVTRQRLYLETMDQILPGIKKVIVPQQGGNLLQFLPLGESTAPAAAAAAASTVAPAAPAPAAAATTAAPSSAAGATVAPRASR